MIKNFLPLFLLSVFQLTNSFAQYTYEYDNSVAVLENNEALRLAWAGGLNSGQYQSIDLNRDGQEDLAIFDRTSDKVNTFIWAEGSYEYNPHYEALFPTDLNGWLVIADFNCDGVEDLITNSTFGMKALEGTVVDGVINWTLAVDPIVTEGFSSEVNLQVNASDIPAITDIDGDGDLDIFVFNFARGGTIEYHQNLSMENDGSCGLEFKRVIAIWGDFQECTCGVYAFGTSCSEIDGKQVLAPEKLLHAGGKALLLLDLDGDGDKDMLFGDEECDNLAFFNNAGNSTTANFNSFNLTFPDDVPTDFLAPASYLVDVDHDGLKDLLIAPNAHDNKRGTIDFRNSSSFYLNTGTNEIPQFVFQQDDFLQQEMIDRGSGAAPALSDINKDGIVDLIVGNGGIVEGEKFYATISLYQNTGTASIPEFSLQTNDYLQLSKLGFVEIVPGFADINGDGFQDLYFKRIDQDNAASLHYILSQDGSFSAGFLLNEIDISISINDKAVIGNINDDDFADIIIYRSSGRIDYFENQKQAATAEFTQLSDSFAGFTDVFANRNLTPALFDIDEDGDSELIISNSEGQLFFIDDHSTHQTGLENALPLTVQNNILEETVILDFGHDSQIAFGSIFSGEFPTMVVGSNQGGLYLLRNSEGSTIPGKENFVLEVFPNPTDDILTVKVSKNAGIILYNALGELVWKNSDQIGGVEYNYNFSALAAGIYLVKAIDSKGNTHIKKIIVL